MVTVPNPYPQETWEEITDFTYLTRFVVKREVRDLLDRPAPGRDGEYTVAEPYRVGFRLDRGAQRIVEVPAGFRTDLVSAPGIAALFGVRRVGPYLEGAVLHDFLYIAWQHLEDEAGRAPRREDRRFADAMYRAAMTAARVPAAKVAAIHAAVRVFGWPVYRAANAGTFAAAVHEF